MALVDDVSEWKKWWSMRFIILTTFLSAIPVAYLTLPADWLPSIPETVKAVLAYAALGSAGAAAVARVVKQKPTEGK